MSRARWHAGRLREQDLAVHHLLLGVVDALAEAGSDNAITGAGIDVERFQAQLQLRIHGGEAAPSTAPLPFSDGCLRAFQLAQQCAAGEVDAIHLLRAALTSDPNTTSIADTALRAAGSEFDEFVAALDATLAFGPAAEVVLEPHSRRPDLELAFHPELGSEQIAAAVRALGELFRDCGGAGLEFRFELQTCAEAVPEGV